jgi:hypothetical protein
MNICVYCASSDRVDSVYGGVAAHLGRDPMQRRHRAAFGADRRAC